MDPNELNGLMALLDSMDNDFVERSPPRKKYTVYPVTLF